MLRTYVYEYTYVLLKYDPRLKYPLCYDPQIDCELSVMITCVNYWFFKNIIFAYLCKQTINSNSRV